MQKPTAREGFAAINGGNCRGSRCIVALVGKAREILQPSEFSQVPWHVMMLSASFHLCKMLLLHGIGSAYAAGKNNVNNFRKEIN